MRVFRIFLLLVFVLGFSLLSTVVYAATSPSLGIAASFAILSSTYTNTVGGTTLSGDLGYTTGPAMTPTVNGTTYVAPNATYASAGSDQGSALTALNSQPCTHTFPAGAVDLATDTSHGTIGVYTPGVYCTTTSSAASIGTGGITLSGSGTYIFRIDGALTTVANSVVTLSNGASSCDVFWTPTGATTLGANSNFKGTVIDDAGITIGSNVTWTGRALAYAGTVSTDTDTISTACLVASITTISSSSTTSSTTNNAAPENICIADAITTIPSIIETRRLSPTSIFLNWGPYAGLDRFNIRYGMTNGEWLYNYDFTGFSTTITDLAPNQPYWFQVAARNNCFIGTYGTSTLAGVPSLPNTGNDPDSSNLVWYATSGILLAGVILIKIARILNQ